MKEVVDGAVARGEEHGGEPAGGGWGAGSGPSASTSVLS